MENVRRCVSEEVLKLVKNKKKKTVISCGKGKKGGDGFVTPKYLFNSNFNVEVYYTGEEGKFSGITRTNFEILENLGVKIFPLANSFKNRLKYKKFDLIIDAILGTGIKRLEN